MNNQGGFNRNANIHNEVNRHQPIRSMLSSSTNSHTIGSDERIPDRLSRPDINLPYQENNSNIVPNNESDGALNLNISTSSSNFTGSRQMFPDRLQSNIHSSAEDVRNNQDNNLNLSLSLSSHSPSGSRGEEGMDGVFLANTRVLPSKRRYSDLGGEMLTEESSRRGVELVAQQLVASSDQANSNNNELATINRSSEFEAAIGQRPVSNMQNQTQATIAPPTYLFLQSDRSPFISSSRTADGATSSVQPLGYAHQFTEPQLASPQINIMSSRNNAPPIVLPDHNSITTNENNSVARSETQGHDNSRITILLHARTDMRNRLMDEVRAALRFLDPSIPMSDVRNLPFEQVIQILRNMLNLEDANTGLTEEQILKHIKCEKFDLVGEETLENKEACVICQEDYVNREEVGRLDCVHRFHINCIKQWLVLKNLCPICKQRALATDGDDVE